MSPSWERDLEAAIAKSRATIGEEAWQAGYAAGRSLSLEAVVAEVLGSSPP